MEGPLRDALEIRLAGHEDAIPAPRAALVAASELHRTASEPAPFYKNAQWSADGTTLIASTSTASVLSYVLPANLLDPATPGGPASPRALQPQGRLALPVPAASMAPAPYYSLAQPWSQVALVGSQDLPIQMYSLFPEGGDESEGDDSDGSDDNDTSNAHAHHHSHRPPRSLPTTRAIPLATYPLMKHETEAFLTPNALLWPAPGTHFVAGTANLLALFDVTRTVHDEPLLRVPTIPSTRHLRKGNGVGMRGVVAALATPSGDSDGAASLGLLAAGTWTRCLGLYDLTRAGGACVATWSLDGVARLPAYAAAYRHPAAGGRRGDSGDSGNGVVQLLWSPCGRYLVVNERRAPALLVYDVRGAGTLLCLLAGRASRTNQRLSCDVYAGSAGGAGGFEVWAGTETGAVAVWEGVGTREGVLQPTWQFGAGQAAGQGADVAVGCTLLHASGSVVATCSGPLASVEGRRGEEESDSDSDSDSGSDSGSDSDSESDEERDSDDDDDSDDSDDDDDDDTSNSDSGSDDNSDAENTSVPSQRPRPSRARQKPTPVPSLQIWSLLPSSS